MDSLAFACFSLASHLLLTSIQPDRSLTRRVLQFNVFPEYACFFSASCSPARVCEVVSNIQHEQSISIAGQSRYIAFLPLLAFNGVLLSYRERCSTFTLGVELEIRFCPISGLGQLPASEPLAAKTTNIFRSATKVNQPAKYAKRQLTSATEREVLAVILVSVNYAML